MTEKNEELRRQIEDLKSELTASMRREEMRNIAVSGNSLKRKIKNRIKNTRLWRISDDPDNRLGKIIRSPRTIARIVTNPSVANAVREKNRHVKLNKRGNSNIFVPIKFFFGENSERRVNVVLEDIDFDMIKMGVLLARAEELPLRIVATKDRIDAVWYRKKVKEGVLPQYNEVSFYSTVEQNQRVRIFELEISKNDVFLTKAWNVDEKP